MAAKHASFPSITPENVGQVFKSALPNHVARRSFQTLVDAGCDDGQLSLLLYGYARPDRRVVTALTKGRADVSSDIKRIKRVTALLHKAAKELWTLKQDGLLPQDVCTNGPPLDALLEVQAFSLRLNTESSLRRRRRDMHTNDLPLANVCLYVEKAAKAPHYAELAELLTVVGREAIEPNTINQKLLRFKKKYPRRVLELLS